MSDLRLPAKLTPRPTIGATLEVVTPIYGGATVPRKLDAIDGIRAASIRGHLRFWWRALHGHTFDSPGALFQREREIWGGVGGEGATRSSVAVRVRVIELAGRDPAELDKLDRGAAYALFPARKQSDGTPEAPRRSAGTKFELSLALSCDAQTEVHDALLAWVLFGGYGGRTRRGLGSMTVVDSPDILLPKSATQAAIQERFAAPLFGQPSQARDMPSLRGARLYTPPTVTNAIEAWYEATRWLRDFRQGTELGPPLRAREPAPPGAKQQNRPSRSNWPEPDKVRRFSSSKGLPWAHPPRHNEHPAWPRAGFGLPIIGRFQGMNRDKVPWQRGTPPAREPDDFKIVWFEGDKPRERLASPLILKPLPLLDRKFAAMALWLHRSHPPGLIGLESDPRDGRRAPFDRLVAPGDTARFEALVGKATLQDAFFDWLAAASKSKPKSKGRYP